MSNNELYHYGVKGMKWGVRKQRSGLTSFGERRVSRKYKKYSKKTQAALAKIENRLYVDAYNKANSKAYSSKDMTVSEVDDLIDKYYSKSYADFVRKNKNYRKGKALCEKYNMIKWDALAKDNEDFLKEMDKK